MRHRRTLHYVVLILVTFMSVVLLSASGNSTQIERILLQFPVLCNHLPFALLGESAKLPVCLVQDKDEEACVTAFASVGRGATASDLTFG